MASRSSPDPNKQDTRSKVPGLTRDGHHLFSPPNAIPDYATRNLPPTPLKLRCTTSPVRDSGNDSCRPTTGRFDQHEPPTPHPDKIRDSRGTHGLEGSINGYDKAMVQPPYIDIATNLHPATRPRETQEIVHPPHPEAPSKKTVRCLDIGDSLEVSPLMSSPLMRNLSYQMYEVSPLTPENTCTMAPEQATSESEHNLHRRAAGTEPNSRRGSRWADLPPAGSQTWPGFYPAPVDEGRRRPTALQQQPQATYSDPGSPRGRPSTASGAWGPAGPKRHLEAHSRTNNGPRPGNEVTRAPPIEPTLAANEYTMAPRYGLGTRGHGRNMPSPAPSSPSRISSAVEKTPSAPTQAQAVSKHKPGAPPLAWGKAEGERWRRRTLPEYPKALGTIGAYQHKDEPKRPSWTRGSVNIG